MLESHEGVKSDEEDECDTDPSDTLEPPGASVNLILPVRLSRLPSIQSFQSKHSFFRSRKPTISCDRWQIHSFNPFKNMNPVSETGKDHISTHNQMKYNIKYNIKYNTKSTLLLNRCFALWDYSHDCNISLYYSKTILCNNSCKSPWFKVIMCKYSFFFHKNLKNTI